MQVVYDDIRPYLAASDIFVFKLSGRIPKCGTSGRCHGIPCIVTDIPGSNEIIINNQNGLIVSVKDKDQLFSAMLQLLSDANLRKYLSNNSRSMIVNRYQQRPLWAALLEDYRSLLRAITPPNCLRKD